MFGYQTRKISEWVQYQEVIDRLHGLEIEIGQLKCSHPIDKRSIKINSRYGYYHEVCMCGKEFRLVTPEMVPCEKAKLERTKAEYLLAKSIKEVKQCCTTGNT